MSCDCYVALPSGAMGFTQFVIVVIPDHTHYFVTDRQGKAGIFKSCRLNAQPLETGQAL